MQSADLPVVERSLTFLIHYMDVDGTKNDENGKYESEGSDGLTETSRAASSVDFSSIQGGEADDPRPARHGKKKKLKKSKKADLYALLGLQHERWMATESQIRSAYRKAALEHHPDKKRAKSAGDLKALQENEENFKAIQDAYETLSDPAKRREFDSLDPFDDSLPNESQAVDPDDFFKHFGAAFKRNSKWSVKKPVPDLGDMETNDADVDAFYSFWFSFKSWREFPHPDEEDVEAAECREERRWIERHNAKLREKGRKEEIRRINEFVDLANRVDPRLVRRRQEERLEKERQKAEKEAARQRRIEEEIAAKELEEKIRMEEEAAKQEAKKQRQIEKKALQKERSKLRKLTGIQASDDMSPRVAYPVDDVELICSQMDLMSLQRLNADLASESSEEEKVQVLKTVFEEALSLEQSDRKAKETAAKSAALAAKKEEKEALEKRLANLDQWTAEEIRLLNKALDKFPPGTSRRWETIQGYLRTRTTEEIIDMVKYGLKSGKYTAPSAELVINEKKKAKSQTQSAATLRHESFTDVSVKQSAPAKDVDSNDSSPYKWSKEEEMKLVKALKEFPKTLEDRWDRVAAAVGSKTKVACAIRFKELKKSVKAKK